VAQSKIRFSPGELGGRERDSTLTTPLARKTAPLDVIYVVTGITGWGFLPVAESRHQHLSQFRSGKVGRI
jgi:hypothetical protein